MANPSVVEKPHRDRAINESRRKFLEALESCARRNISGRPNSIWKYLRLRIVVLEICKSVLRNLAILRSPTLNRDIALPLLRMEDESSADLGHTALHACSQYIQQLEADVDFLGFLESHSAAQAFLRGWQCCLRSRNQT